jgi:hypothetical protein
MTVCHKSSKITLSVSAAWRKGKNVLELAFSAPCVPSTVINSSHKKPHSAALHSFFPRGRGNSSVDCSLLRSPILSRSSPEVVPARAGREKIFLMTDVEARQKREERERARETNYKAAAAEKRERAAATLA